MHASLNVPPLERQVRFEVTCSLLVCIWVFFLLLLDLISMLV